MSKRLTCDAALRAAYPRLFLVDFLAAIWATSRPMEWGKGVRGMNATTKREDLHEGHLQVWWHTQTGKKDEAEYVDVDGKMGARSIVRALEREDDTSSSPGARHYHAIQVMRWERGHWVQKSERWWNRD